jgi:hypothetical protein
MSAIKKTNDQDGYPEAHQNDSKSFQTNNRQPERVVYDRSNKNPSKKNQ